MKYLERSLFFLFFLIELGIGFGIIAWILAALTTVAYGEMFFGISMLLSAFVSAYITFPIHLF